MGLRGPVAKTAEQRKYEGCAAHRPMPAAPAARTGLPERPKGMTAGARRVWDAYSAQLAAAGILRPMDVFALRRLCEDVAALEALQKGVRQLVGEMKRTAKAQGKRLAGGAMVVLTASDNGRRLAVTMSSLASRIQRQEMQFGLTPMSGQRLAGGEYAGAVVPMQAEDRLEMSIQ